MIEWIYAQIITHPAAVRWVGRLLFSIGGGLVILGLRAEWLISKVMRRFARANLEGPQTLAEMYPTLWTWWIPETVFGYQVAVFLLVVGLALTQLAKSVPKYR